MAATVTESEVGSGSKYFGDLSLGFPTYEVRKI